MPKPLTPNQKKEDAIKKKLFQQIKSEYREGHPIGHTCKRLGVGRATYYRWRAKFSKK